MNPAFIDVSFPDQGFLTGDLGRSDVFGSDIPLFGDAIKTIPRSRWESLITAPDYTGCEALITRVYNQNGDPSCTSNATCQAHEITQAKQAGKDQVIHLSAISLYKRVGSPRSGSSVSDNLRELRDVGILPLDNETNRGKFTHVMQANGYSNRFPAGWESTANRFRGREWFDIRSSEEFFTALLLGMPVVYGRQGHAICGVRAVIDRGTLYCKYANSWGTWGDAGGDFSSGFGYDSERLVSRAGYAFALRSITIEGI